MMAAPSGPAAVVLTPTDLVAYLHEYEFELDGAGRPREPLALVDLTAQADANVMTAAADAARHADMVLVGVAPDGVHPAALPLAEATACTVSSRVRGPAEVGVSDVDAALNAIRTTVARAPRAALALCQVLRVTGSVSPCQGLVVESLAYSMLLAGGEFAAWRACRPVRPLPNFPDPPVLVRRDGDVLVVTLNREGRHNAFSRDVRDGLVDAFDLAARDPSLSGVRLRANGPSFCSGGDLDEFGSSADVSTAHMIRIERSVADRIERMRTRVEATVHGACIGAGIEIPSFAGRIVARDDAYFALPELAMGLIPGAGGTVGISRRIGRWRTAYLALTGQRIDVAIALAWGLVDDRV